MVTEKVTEIARQLYMHRKQGGVTFPRPSIKEKKGIVLIIVAKRRVDMRLRCVVCATDFSSCICGHNAQANGNPNRGDSPSIESRNRVIRYVQDVIKGPKRDRCLAMLVLDERGGLRILDMAPAGVEAAVPPPTVLSPYRCRPATVVAIVKRYR